MNSKTHSIRWSFLPAGLQRNNRTAILLGALIVFTVMVYHRTHISRFVQKSSSYSPETLTWLSNWIATAGMHNQLSVKNGFIVHYILLHKSLNPSPENSLTWLECMSVLSVLKNLTPDAVFIHTNVPQFWPFNGCETVITNWTTVHLKSSPLKLVSGGRKIRRLEHEADIKKLEAVFTYGGLALDFDVFVINGTKLREQLTRFPCVGCRETQPWLNAGFLACGQPGAVFPGLVLDRYRSDFRPDIWIWNSGDLPYQIYMNHTDTLNVKDNNVCDRPDYFGRGDFLNNTGLVEWRDKIAHHAFLHDRCYNQTTAEWSNTSMAEMLRWILSNAHLI